MLNSSSENDIFESFNSLIKILFEHVHPPPPVLVGAVHRHPVNGGAEAEVGDGRGYQVMVVLGVRAVDDRTGKVRRLKSEKK